ncbi:TPA: hypothetical protein P6N57_004702 [Pseudomonas aeruginosa]|nr:hypothetical protein [Pseudomonas aeruginosa]HDP3901615.1 hypothetical protein [Pseudomonas aeruginosa]
MESTSEPVEGFYWRKNRTTGRWEVVEFDGESFCQSHAGGGGDIFSIDEAGEVIGPLRDPVSNAISEVLSVISKQQALDMRRTLETLQKRLRENQPIDNSERLLLLNLVNASLI